MIKWEKTIAGFVNQTLLPPNAQIRIRVSTMCNDEETPHKGLPQSFAVNGQQYTATRQGDEFIGKVDGNGRVLVGRYDPAHASSSTGELLFGHHEHSTGIARWYIGVTITQM